MAITSMIDTPDAIAFLSWSIDRCSNKRTAIEVGAYVGEYTRYMASQFDFVMAFEPIENSFQKLEQNIQKRRLVNVTVRQEALGHTTGKAVMHCKDPLFPSRHWRTGPSATCTQVIVPITTIDALDLKDVDFIKINVNGSESRVVKGALATIKKHKPIVFVCEDMDPHRAASTHLLHLDMKQIAVSNRTFVFGW